MKRLKKIISYTAKHLQKISGKILYTILLLYYAFRSKETPGWAKNIILGAFAYLLSPIDGIPDITPLVGMTDDAGVLSFALVTIACYINDDIREKARKGLQRFFPGEFNSEELQEVDKML